MTMNQSILFNQFVSAAEVGCMLNCMMSRHRQRMDQKVLEAYIKILTHCLYQDTNTLPISRY